MGAVIERTRGTDVQIHHHHDANRKTHAPQRYRLFKRRLGFDDRLLAALGGEPAFDGLVLLNDDGGGGGHARRDDGKSAVQVA